MFGKATIKVSSTLLDRARKAADIAGYSSVEEFIEHAIEKDLTHRESEDDADELIRRLKGLGYIE